ncbi:MAG: hypothetical protein ACRCXR_03980 [Weissella cibaria]|nr:hypothetical protein [Weissella cibaria]
MLNQWHVLLPMFRLLTGLGGLAWVISIITDLYWGALLIEEVDD